MLITQYARMTQCTTVLRGDAKLDLWYSSFNPPACIWDPPSIRGNMVLVCGYYNQYQTVHGPGHSVNRSSTMCWSSSRDQIFTFAFISEQCATRNYRLWRYFVMFPSYMWMWVKSQTSCEYHLLMDHTFVCMNIHEYSRKHWVTLSFAKTKV